MIQANAMLKERENIANHKDKIMYTKEQLIEAQYEYNIAYEDDPDRYSDTPDWRDRQTAIDQIEYLISLIDESKNRTQFPSNSQQT